MRATRAALGLLLPMCLLPAGLVAGSAGPAQAAPDEGSSASSPLPAIEADAVVDRYGIGIHLNFLDTPYRDHEAVADLLDELGVRHVRDDLYLDAPRQYAAIAAVAARDIDFDLIMGRPGGTATPADYVATVAEHLPAGSVESLEGVNEWDLLGGDDWVEEMKQWQEGLWTAARAEPATADLPVLSPALAFPWNYAAAGDLSEYADVANAHMYPGGYRPSNQIGRITAAVRESVPDGPLVTTEAGYHNALGTTHGHRPVPEEVAAAYLPRLLLAHVIRGEQRLYSYELIDSFADPEGADPEAHFGLVRHDLSRKPAFTAMKNLLGLLEDPGPSFTPGTLDVTASGLPADARYQLTQQRDGRFVLLLWRDVALWNPETQQRIEVSPAEVTLRLDEEHVFGVVRPTERAAAEQHTSGTSVTVPLDGQVSAVLIDPVDSAGPPVPTGLSTTAGHRSAIVRWGLTDSSVEPLGFEVRRSPGGQVSTVGPGARSFVESGLRNGRDYSYEVRTLTAQGPSTWITGPAVVPATVPNRPGRVAARVRGSRVRVRWTAAAGRGRPVTAYRVTALGRRVTVDPARLRAVVRRLPHDRRFRVRVRARNELGWGRARVSRVVRTR